MPPKSRKQYLGPDVGPQAKVPKTTKWRYEHKASASSSDVGELVTSVQLSSVEGQSSNVIEAAESLPLAVDVCDQPIQEESAFFSVTSSCISAQDLPSQDGAENSISNVDGSSRSARCDLSDEHIPLERTDLSHRSFQMAIRNPVPSISNPSFQEDFQEVFSPRDSFGFLQDEAIVEGELLLRGSRSPQSEQGSMILQQADPSGPSDPSSSSSDSDDSHQSSQSQSAYLDENYSSDGESDGDREDQLQDEDYSARETSDEDHNSKDGENINDAADEDRQQALQDNREVLEDQGGGNAEGELPYHDDHERNPEGLNYDQNPSHGKLRMRMHGTFQPPIDVPVNVSRNDALYMALGLARRENFGNTAFYNAVKLINALFVTPILQSTIDSLDGLLLSDCGVRYFFFCSSCSKSFGELAYKTIKTLVCLNCGVRNVISDLRVAHFFVMFNVPHQLQNMLGNRQLADALLSPAEAVARSRDGVISDIWDGTMYKEFAAAVVNFQCRVFSFNFCVDGSPLVVSSKRSIWPIQLALNELPIELRGSNLLLAGLWFGLKQAKMDLFLKPFTDHFRQISGGFNLKINNIVEHARAFCTGSCVDSGARGKVQGIKTHSGYYSCNWCLIRGEWVGGAVRFPLHVERPPDRTHQSILRSQNLLIDNPLSDEEEDEEENPDDPGVGEGEQVLQGVNSISPLINMPYFGDGAIRTPSFDMVNSFFVDSMHSLDLGISKFFLTRWMEDYGHEYYIKESANEIDARIKTLRPPIEFRRLPRTLDERARFNARECQNWMMYCCVPVLSGILREKYLKVWMHLTQALYLLSEKDVSHNNVDIADSLIKYFLTKTQEYYGDAEMTFNLHIITHLCANTLRHGPLWATNAYCFEDGNGKLKRVIHSAQGIPHQVIRSLSWAESFRILESVVSPKARDFVAALNQTEHHKQRSIVVGGARLLGKLQEVNLTAEELHQCANHHHLEEDIQCYPKLVYKNCLFTDDSDRSIRWDNSVVQLNDRSVVVIRKILFDSVQNIIFLLVSDVNFETMLVPPIGVRLHRDSHFMRKITSINEELRYIKSCDLNIVCFRASMPEGEFLAPLPNVYNRQ